MTDPGPVEIPVNAKFIYNKPDDYDTHYVNGLLGGLTARGEIILNFFFEHSDVPKDEEDVIVNGKLKPKPASSSSLPEVQRDIKACVVVSPEHAKGMSEFILELVNQYDCRIKGASDKREGEYVQ